MKGILVIIISLIVFSCNNVYKAQKKTDNIISDEYTSESIIIQPFLGFPNALTLFIQAEIKKINPDVKIRKPITLPNRAYNKDTGRYRADSLISYLQTKGYGNSVVIGLTNQDLSIPKGLYK